MKLRPILFSAPMVRAILAGTKTQTRRIVKPQPITKLCKSHAVDNGRPYWCDYTKPRRMPDNGTGDVYILGALPVRVFCPYGQPGDRLWVRETWGQFFDDEFPADRPRGPHGTMGCPATPNRISRVFYRADGEAADACWRPSIHMPRWASRITLEITGVRVERLREISENDAAAEGVTLGAFSGGDNRDARVAYHALWESINGHGSWAANPWVWVVEFRRIA